MNAALRGRTGSQCIGLGASAGGRRGFVYRLTRNARVSEKPQHCEPFPKTNPTTPKAVQKTHQNDPAGTTPGAAAGRSDRPRRARSAHPEQARSGPFSRSAHCALTTKTGHCAAAGAPGTAAAGAARAVDVGGQTGSACIDLMFIYQPIFDRRRYQKRNTASHPERRGAHCAGGDGVRLRSGALLTINNQSTNNKTSRLRGCFARFRAPKSAQTVGRGYANPREKSQVFFSNRTIYQKKPTYFRPFFFIEPGFHLLMSTVEANEAISRLTVPLKQSTACANAITMSL